MITALMCIPVIAIIVFLIIFAVREVGWEEVLLVISLMISAMIGLLWITEIALRLLDIKQSIIYQLWGL